MVKGADEVAMVECISYKQAEYSNTLIRERIGEYLPMTIFKQNITHISITEQQYNAAIIAPHVLV